MKKLRFLSILALFLLQFLFCSETASAQEIRGRGWRLQGVFEADISLFFGYEGTFMIFIKNPATKEEGSMKGTYNMSKNTIEAYINDITLLFKIQWRTNNSFYLVGNNVKYLYCDSYTKEDTYDSDYASFVQSIYSQQNYTHFSFDSFSGSDNRYSGTEKCNSCFGYGQCPTYHGSGDSIAPDYTGNRTQTPPCTWCHGTGRCPKCNGSGHR